MDCLVQSPFVCSFRLFHSVYVVFFFLSGMKTDEADAITLLSDYNSTAEVVWNAFTEASWKYNTDINEANNKAMVRSAR